MKIKGFDFWAFCKRYVKNFLTSGLLVQCRCRHTNANLFRSNLLVIQTYSVIINVLALLIAILLFILKFISVSEKRIYNKMGHRILKNFLFNKSMMIEL